MSHTLFQQINYSKKKKKLVFPSDLTYSGPIPRIFVRLLMDLLTTPNLSPWSAVNNKRYFNIFAVEVAEISTLSTLYATALLL